MYAGYSFQELFIVCLLSFVAIGTLIAAIDYEPINRIGLGYIKWISRAWAWSRFMAIFLIPFAFPALIVEKIPNPGWRSGLAFISLFSSLFLLGIIGLLIVGAIYPVSPYIDVLYKK